MRIINELAEEYKGKYVVSKAVLEQIMWERDIAIEQLKELGYGLGEKVGWIPVSERLPEDEQSIIAKYADGKIWQENFSLYLYENPRTYQMVLGFQCHLNHTRKEKIKMSDKPIIRHCQNCKYSIELLECIKCDVKYDYCFCPRVKALFCKYYKPRGVKNNERNKIYS